MWTRQPDPATDTPELHIRPLVPSDADALDALYTGLSQISRYHRFHNGCSRLPTTLLRYLTQIDGHDHIAFVAVSQRHGQVARLIGEARCVRGACDPACADLGITVTDSEQRRGVGRSLLYALSQRAAAHGIDAFTAEVLSENRGVIAMLAKLDATLTRREGCVLSYRVPLSAFDARRH
jgi:RimJ/RimL family protein N-acetyltransferase